MMKLKYIIVIFSLLFSLVLSAEDSGRRDAHLKILDQEIGEMIRLTKNVGKENPVIFVRLMYLLIEKGKLLREKENDKYLKISPKKRSGINKKTFYKKSRRFLVKARKVANFGLKKFSTYSGKGSFYHGISEVYLELGESNKFYTNIKKVFKLSRKGSKTYKRSGIKLGEYFFNKQRYSEALKYYRLGLSGKKNKWWTKDAYRMAWCYLMTNKSDKGLEVMKEVYKLSKKPEFIDNSFRAEKEIAYFYAMAGRFREAIKFYKKTSGNLEDKIVRVSKYLVNKGKHTAAEKILEYGLRNIDDGKKGVALKTNILLIYKKFGKYKKHQKIIVRLFKKFEAGYTDSFQEEVLKNELKEVTGILQKQIFVKNKKKNKNIFRFKMFQVVKYLEMLSKVDPSKKNKYMMLAGETLFSFKLFRKSLSIYKKIILTTEKPKNNKIFKKSLEGYLASLKKVRINKKEKEELNKLGFKSIILVEPKSERSNISHQRLFSIYLKGKRLNECEDVFLSYRANFPDSLKEQEIMLTKMMTFYKKNKNDKELFFWASKIRNKEFQVSERLLKKVRLLFLNLKFSRVEKDAVKGNKLEALKGYLRIYKKSPKDVESKKNSAINASILFYEGHDLRRAYYWMKKSFKFVKRKEVFKFEKVAIQMADSLFERRFFKESSDLYFSIFKKTCFTKSNNKESLLKNASLIYLSEGNHRKVIEALSWAKRCKADGKSSSFIKIELVKYFYENNLFNYLEKYLSKFSKDQEILPSLLFYFEKLSVSFSKIGRFEKSNIVKSKIIKYYKSLTQKNISIPLKSLNSVSKILKRNVEEQVRAFEQVKLRFPERVFNTALETKLKMLDSITSNSISLMKIGSSLGIVSGYHILIKVYKKFIREIERFRPAGKSLEYVDAFRDSMNKLRTPLIKKVSEFEKEARSKILSNNILTEDNYKVLISPKMNLLNLKYYPLRDGILMDRRGRN
ncbi:MAG: hypothetical protein CME68_07205 [Halobacteriovoraceae bacterium]|nr:hypothetical protein [Halobacteriovoraceae bacterium]